MSYIEDDKLFPPPGKIVITASIVLGSAVLAYEAYFFYSAFRWVAGLF